MLADSEQRAFLFNLWEKIQGEDPLSPLEKQIERIIDMHPETHSVLSNRETFEAHEFDADEPDPFAHIGLHSVVVEMISNDSPRGIRSVYDRRVTQTDNKHEVQHEIMSALFEILIESTDREPEFDEHAKLMALLEQRLSGSGDDGSRDR